MNRDEIHCARCAATIAAGEVCAELAEKFDELICPECADAVFDGEDYDQTV